VLFEGNFVIFSYRVKKQSKKSKYKLYYSGKLSDINEFDIFYKSLYQMSKEQKFIETWKLTETMIQLQGRNPDELRLDRTTLILKRLF
jgi:hypothetical protein